MGLSDIILETEVCVLVDFGTLKILIAKAIRSKFVALHINPVRFLLSEKLSIERETIYMKQIFFKQIYANDLAKMSGYMRIGRGQITEPLRLAVYYYAIFTKHFTEHYFVMGFEL